jgi:ribosome-associated protein
LTTKLLAKKIALFALEKKAHQVLVMDLRKTTDMTDFFVVCSADSDTQVKAVADHIIDETSKIGMEVWHNEGLAQRQWVLLDYVDVVVHIFHKDMRKFYGLEKLWGDAKIEEVSDEPVVQPAPAAKKKAAPRKAAKPRASAAPKRKSAVKK